MIGRIRVIAFNTFREAVRDRVLYNLVVFAILMVGGALLLGRISLRIERLVLVNLGLTAIALFGIVIAIFLGIGLVSKEIERRTLYTVLAARPVRRWEFIVGKQLGLIATLVVNAGFMSAGFFAALLYLQHRFEPVDRFLLVALYFIVLQFIVITSLAMMFSTFSSPLLSTIFTFALFVIGTFAEDLRGFGALGRGLDPRADHRTGVCAAQFRRFQRCLRSRAFHTGTRALDPVQQPLCPALCNGCHQRGGADL